MEIIGLLAIGMVIGIPAMAIVALVRTRSAERRIDESWSKISDLEGDIAGLRREVAKISDRGFKLETPAVRKQGIEREVASLSHFSLLTLLRPLETSKLDPGCLQSLPSQ
jgi:hypothetical protein